MNILLSAAGRRPYLVRWFREACAMNGVDGRILLADADPTAPAQGIADRFILAPRVGDSTYPEWLRALLRNEAIGLALSLNDFELSLWSRLDDSEPGLSPLVRLHSRVQDLAEDKLETAAALTAHGVPVPHTTVAASYAGGTSGAVVVKGRFGSGSRGLAVVQDGHIGAAIARARPAVTDRSGAHASDASSADELIVVQSHIEGQEFGLDIVNDLDGNFVTVLARRKISMRFGETDQAETVDPERFVEVGTRISHVTRHHGLIDVDLIVDADGTAWVIDVNPRFGGGYPFSHLGGAHIPAAYVAWALGREPKPEWLWSEPAVTSAKFVEIARTSGPSSPPPQT